MIDGYISKERVSLLFVWNMTCVHNKYGNSKESGCSDLNSGRCQTAVAPAER